MPDAAGLVLASDQDDARAYAQIVERVTGHKPALILSDDPGANKRIKDFTHSDERIAVCVRMISEGVDVPRAACLAWLTSYRTPLFFAQAVGRVVRARGGHESATVFLPAVRPLLTLAAEMEAERNHVIPPPAPGSDLLESLDLEVPDEVVGSGFEALESDAEFAHVLHGGRAVLADEDRDISADEADFLGLPGLLSPEQTAALLARRDREMRRRAVGGAGVDDEPAAEELAGYQQVAALRRQLSAMVSAYALASGRPHGSIHAELRRRTGGPPTPMASLEQLEARIAALQKL
jgi:hypothetical protein